MNSENGMHHRSRRRVSQGSGERYRNRNYTQRSSAEGRASSQGNGRGGERSSSGISSQGYARRKGRQTKNNKNNNIPMIVGGIALLIVIIAVLAFLIKGGAFGGESSSEMIETQAEGSFKNDVFVDLSEIVDEIPAESSEDSETPETEETEESEEASTEALGAAVINLKGLTPEEAKTKIAGLYTWKMTVSNPDAEEGSTVKPTVNAEEITTEAATMPDAENPDSLPEGESPAETEPQEIVVKKLIEVPDLIAVKTDELIDMIADSEEFYTAADALAETDEEEGSEESGESETEAAPNVYTLSLEGLDEEIDKVVLNAENMWNKTAMGGSIGSYDKETDSFKMEGAKDGYKLDTEKLRSDINSAISAKDFAAEIPVSGTVISGSDDTSLPEYKIIGTYTTETTSNKVRNKNIQLACQALNGTIVRPGEEFSFNDTVGERTEAKGYGAAAAYNNGEVVQEIGGGVCQVSTTLYNAVLKSGLKTTKRQSHTFKPTYVTPGFDATISWGGPDYRFINAPSIDEYSNSSSYSIGIRASYSNQKVTVSIYGRPILKDGISYELKSEKVKDIPVVRKPIPAGSDKTPTTGTQGSQWVTNLVIKKNGEVISDKLDHNTYYSGHIEYYDENAETSSETMPSSTDPSASETGETVETAATPAESTEPSYVQGPEGGPGVTAAPTQSSEIQPTPAPTTGVQSIEPTAASSHPETASAPAPAVDNSGSQGPVSGPQSGGGGVVSDAPVSPI